MEDERRWDQADPEYDLVLDATSMRAIAHPVRIRILGILRTDGPQTATTLADRLSLNSGATSYHLRQLADHGMAVEVPGKGRGRERWWQAAHRSTRLQMTSLNEPGGQESLGYLQALALFYGEHLQRAIDAYPEQPMVWRRASTFSDYLFRLGPDEARRLLEDLLEVLGRYRAYDSAPESAPADADTFHVQIQTFRLPDS